MGSSGPRTPRLTSCGFRVIRRRSFSPSLSTVPVKKIRDVKERNKNNPSRRRAAQQKTTARSGKAEPCRHSGGERANTRGKATGQAVASEAGEEVLSCVGEVGDVCDFVGLPLVNAALDPCRVLPLEEGGLHEVVEEVPSLLHELVDG